MGRPGTAPAHLARRIRPPRRADNGLFDGDGYTMGRGIFRPCRRQGPAWPAAGRAHAAHLAGRVCWPGPPARPRALAAACARRQGADLAYPVGPPGTGKTTLGAFWPRKPNASFVGAVGGDVRRERSARGKWPRQPSGGDVRGQRTLLFIDEIHRFNKAQQDALLPHVEAGHGDSRRGHDRESFLRGECRRCSRAPRWWC